VSPARKLGEDTRARISGRADQGKFHDNVLLRLKKAEPDGLSSDRRHVKRNEDFVMFGSWAHDDSPKGWSARNDVVELIDPRVLAGAWISPHLSRRIDEDFPSVGGEESDGFGYELVERNGPLFLAAVEQLGPHPRRCDLDDGHATVSQALTL
jgi:hypothetical protein